MYKILINNLLFIVYQIFMRHKVKFMFELRIASINIILIFILTLKINACIHIKNFDVFVTLVQKEQL